MNALRQKILYGIVLMLIVTFGMICFRYKGIQARELTEDEMALLKASWPVGWTCAQCIDMCSKVGTAEDCTGSCEWVSPYPPPGSADWNACHKKYRDTSTPTIMMKAPSYDSEAGEIYVMSCGDWVTCGGMYICYCTEGPPEADLCTTTLETEPSDYEKWCDCE